MLLALQVLLVFGNGAALLPSSALHVHGVVRHLLDLPLADAFGCWDVGALDDGWCTVWLSGCEQT